MKIKDSQSVINEIVNLRYNKLWSNFNIIKYLMDKYSIEKTRAYELTLQAKKNMAETYAATTEKVLEDAINKLEGMQQMAIEQENPKLALEVQKELDKILELKVETLKLETDKIIINIIKNEN